MPNIDTLQTFLEGGKLPVDPHAIASKLAELWQQATASPGATVTRTCLRTWIVHAPTEAQLAQAAGALAELSAAHPSRALLVCAQPEQESTELTAAVAMLCPPPTTAEARVCGEQVLVVARGQAAQQLPEVILPLRLGGLPVTVWFATGLPEKEPLFEHLRDTQAQLVYDSAAVTDLGITLAQAHALATAGAFRPVGDLNWARLAVWRELLAEALAKPEWSAWASQVTGVSMVFGGGVLDEARIAQPALMLSWLAARSGWRLSSALDFEQQAFRSLWETSAREVFADMTVSQEAGTDLESFTLQAQSGADTARLTIAREHDPAGAVLHARLVQGNDQVFSLKRSAPPLPWAALLAQELTREGVTPEEEQALLFATRLV